MCVHMGVQDLTRERSERVFSARRRRKILGILDFCLNFNEISADLGGLVERETWSRVPKKTRTNVIQ